MFSVILSKVETAVANKLGAVAKFVDLNGSDTGVVMWERNPNGNDFGAHNFYIQPNGDVSLYWGHYDMTEEQAFRICAEKRGRI